MLFIDACNQYIRALENFKEVDLEILTTQDQREEYQHYQWYLYHASQDVMKAFKALITPTQEDLIFMKSIYLDDLRYNYS
jgi:hypothetical protein